MIEVVSSFVRRRVRVARERRERRRYYAVRAGRVAGAGPQLRVRDYYQGRTLAAAEAEFGRYAQQHLGRCRSCGEFDVEHAIDVWHEHDLAGHEDGLDWYRFRVHCRACGDDSTYFAPRPEPHHYPRDLRARAVAVLGWLGRWWGGLEAR